MIWLSPNCSSALRQYRYAPIFFIFLVKSFVVRKSVFVGFVVKPMPLLSSDKVKLSCERRCEDGNADNSKSALFRFTGHDMMFRSIKKL